MKNILALAISIVAVSSFVFGQTTGRRMSRDARIRQELIRLEEEWHNAYVRHDPAPLERILADEYIAISSNGGSYNKTQTIEGLRADTATYEYSTPYDMDFRFYGNVVVVIGRTRERGRNVNGTEFTAEYRWTDVFVRRQGRWQCVAAQVARVPPPRTTQ